MCFRHQRTCTRARSEPSTDRRSSLVRPFRPGGLRFLCFRLCPCVVSCLIPRSNLEELVQRASCLDASAGLLLAERGQLPSRGAHALTEARTASVCGSRFFHRRDCSWPECNRNHGGSRLDPGVAQPAALHDRGDLGAYLFHPNIGPLLSLLGSSAPTKLQAWPEQGLGQVSRNTRTRLHPALGFTST